MKRQMNEYVLLLNNAAESSPLPEAAAAFNSQLAKWLQDNGASADVLRTETGAQSAAVSMVCTEEIARRVVEAFSGTVASIRMDRENIITIPAPLPKKTRRPGFGA